MTLLTATKKANGELRYYLTDHLGSTRATIDIVGSVIESHDYYPFGLQMPGRDYLAASVRTKELFTGKERYTETGLDYFGARYYDASIGRWLSVDPLAEKYPSLSPYNYVANNPLSSFDPNGEYIVNASRNKRNGSIRVTATRVTIGSAKTAEFLSYTGVGAVANAIVKLFNNDPSYQFGYSDALGLAEAGSGKIISKLMGDKFIDMTLKLSNDAVNTIGILANERTSLGLDELTFGIANNLSINGVKLGRVGIGPAEHIFTLNRKISGGFRDPQRAGEFLQSQLGAISSVLGSIAESQSFDLSTEDGRNALQKYINDNIKDFQNQLREALQDK